LQPTAIDAGINTNSPRHSMVKTLLWLVVEIFQLVCLSYMMLSYRCSIYFSSAAYTSILRCKETFLFVICQSPIAHHLCLALKKLITVLVNQILW
jgi:hypothetical protein